MASQQICCNAECNGGSVNAESIEVTYDSTYSDLPTLARDGYTFDGWYTEASGGTKIESSTKVTITADQTLYAHWFENTKYIDANGAEGSMACAKITNQTTWSAGWYVVDSNTTISNRITVSGDNMSVTIWADTGKTVHIRYKAAEGNPASDSAEVTISERPEVPSSLTIDNAAEGVTLAKQYCYNSTSASHTGTWTAGAGSKVTVAPEASIYIRTPATDSTFKSAVLTLTAPSWGSMPTVNIDYTAETLNTTTSIQYRVGNGTWTDCENNMAPKALGWNESTAVTVQFRTAPTVDNYASTTQNVSIPAHSSAPTTAIKVTKTGASITITNAADFSGCQFSVDGINWQDGSSFSGLTAGQTYPVSVCTKATDAAFASASQTVNATTVKADGSTTVKPGESVEVGTTPKTTVTNDGEKVTITTDGSTTTTVTPASEVEVGGNGSVAVPGGSTVKTEDGPEVKLPQSDAIGSNGEITIPGGGAAQVGNNPSTTITVPTGGAIKPKPDGAVDVPSGSTVQTGKNGPEITVGPGNGGAVGGDGGVTVEGGGKVTVRGNPDDITIILPSGGGTVKPNPDGAIPLPGGSTIEKGGETTTVPDAGGTYNPKDGAVTENVHTVTFDSQGGSAVGSKTATHWGKMVKPGNPTRCGYAFGGWYKESGCTNAWNFATDTVTGDITLYAKWMQNSGGGGGWYNPPAFPLTPSPHRPRSPTAN